jgi:hypothetical protein
MPESPRMVPLYAARVADLRLGYFVGVTCRRCGHIHGPRDLIAAACMTGVSSLLLSASVSIDDTKEKANIGAAFEARSNNTALFLMAVKQDDRGRSVREQIAAKIDGSY